MGSIWVWRGEKMDRAEGDRRWGRVVREYLRQTAWEASVLDDSNQGLLTLMRWWRREIIFARLDERGVPPGCGQNPAILRCRPRQWGPPQPWDSVSSGAPL